MGRDALTASEKTLLAAFQSTRPHGARRDKDCRVLCSFRVSIHAPAWGATCVIVDEQLFNTGFNPRARMGRDPDTTAVARQGQVSIHAPAWGATSLSPLTPRTDDVFQSTRPHGARPFASSKIQICEEVSIHAPAWGATYGPVMLSILPVFQSTRPHGARLASRPNPVNRYLFQSTRPHGARHHK